MSEAAKHYYVSDGGLVEGKALGRLSVYLSADYKQLEQERDRLKNQRDAILLQARAWACEAKTQQSITQEASEALGGIPTWGPISATVGERLSERDTAITQAAVLRGLLTRCKERLDPHRDAALWSDVCAALGPKP